ncbi:hypothetical protein HGRIS_011359 [Hohenbuehelia grisea]|uniref:Uncharacterized protein n=1 Tax=Hohenbuehelia grisea TaxID=104357 RepID=A0ABR3JUV3_9AGAR
MKFTAAFLVILAVLCGSVHAAPRENAAASEAINQAQLASLNGTAAEWKPGHRDDNGDRREHGGHGGKKLSRVRICWDGKFHYTMLDLTDPNLLKIDAADIYAPKWPVMSLKAYLKNQIQIVVSNSAHYNNVHSLPVPWWAPLYAAGSCMLQERLEADFAFEYKQIPERKTSAEPVYYKQHPSFPAIISAAAIGQFAQEMGSNVQAINAAVAQHAAGNINHRHQIWMVPAFKLRNKQLGEVMAKGPDA